MPYVSLTALIEGVRSGDRLVSFPTDTVPALASLPATAGLIYAAKQRSEAKPLILMAAAAKELWPYVAGSAAEQALWQQTAARYWPGALTLVLPASDRLPPALNPTNPSSIGIRVPNSAIARHILQQTGPLATTSVNRSGEPPLLTPAEIQAQFPQVLTLSPAELEELERSLALSAAPALSGVPSTVAQWTTEGWRVLREGAVKIDIGEMQRWGRAGE